jgi:hypothetical protein
LPRELAYRRLGDFRSNPPQEGATATLQSVPSGNANRYELVNAAAFMKASRCSRFSIR